MFLQNVFDTFEGSIVVPPGPPAPIAALVITPTAGSKLRYSAYAQFRVDAPTAVTFRIVDSVQGVIVEGQQGYPTVPLFLPGTIMLEWEIAGATPGPHIVTLEMETTAGLLEAIAAYLAVDELAP